MHAGSLWRDAPLLFFAALFPSGAVAFWLMSRVVDEEVASAARGLLTAPGPR